MNVIGNVMNFYGKEELWEHAARVHEKARSERNRQAQDLMRSLELLYREMAEELEDRGLFERRFPPLDLTNLVAHESECA